MDWLIFFVIFVVVWFRWRLFERFFGKAGMHILDMLICTVAAASLVAQPGPSPIFNYIMAIFLAIVAFLSAKDFGRHLNNKNAPTDAK